MAACGHVRRCVERWNVRHLLLVAMSGGGGGGRGGSPMLTGLGAAQAAACRNGMTLTAMEVAEGDNEGGHAGGEASGAGARWYDPPSTAAAPPPSPTRIGLGEVAAHLRLACASLCTTGVTLLLSPTTGLPAWMGAAVSAAASAPADPYRVQAVVYRPHSVGATPATTTVVGDGKAGSGSSVDAAPLGWDDAGAVFHDAVDLVSQALGMPPGDVRQGTTHVFGQHVITSSQVFYGTARSLAFVNVKPIVPGHVLVTPRRRAPRVVHLYPDELSDLWAVAQGVGAMLEGHHGAASLNFAIQDGAMAGQTVPHVHIHILPRMMGDIPPEEADRIYDMIDASEEALGHGGAPRARLATTRVVGHSLPVDPSDTPAAPRTVSATPITTTSASQLPPPLVIDDPAAFLRARGAGAAMLNEVVGVAEPAVVPHIGRPATPLSPATPASTVRGAVHAAAIPMHRRSAADMAREACVYRALFQPTTTPPPCDVASCAMGTRLANGLATTGLVAHLHQDPAWSPGPP